MAYTQGFRDSASGKKKKKKNNLPVNAGNIKYTCLIPGLGRSSKKWQTTPEFLLGKSHEQLILVGYSPQGPKESDTTEGSEHTKGKSNL